MKYRVIEKGNKYFAQVSEDGGESWYNINGYGWTYQKQAEDTCKRHKKRAEQNRSPERVVWTMEEYGE